MREQLRGGGGSRDCMCAAAVTQTVFEIVCVSFFGFSVQELIYVFVFL